MALGGWLAGAIHDWTGSYAAALINGIGWNTVNIAIVIWLLRQPLGRAAPEHDPEKCAAIRRTAITLASR
jgi:cyanate permease